MTSPLNRTGIAKTLRILLWCASVIGVGVNVEAGDDIGLRMADSVIPEREQVPVPLPDTGEACGLTLEQLEQMALSSNPSLQRAAALVGAAQGQLGASRTRAQSERRVRRPATWRTFRSGYVTAIRHRTAPVSPAPASANSSRVHGRWTSAVNPGRAPWKKGTAER